MRYLTAIFFSSLHRDRLLLGTSFGGVFSLLAVVLLIDLFDTYAIYL